MSDQTIYLKSLLVHSFVENRELWDESRFPDATSSSCSVAALP